MSTTVDIQSATEMDVRAELEKCLSMLKAAEFIKKENGTLKEDLKTTKRQVNHWRNSSNDAQQMLSRISKQGKNRYADEFYHPALKRVIDTMYSENQILVNKVNKIFKEDKNNQNEHNAVELAKINADLEENIQKLRMELEQKYKDNRRLQIAIENITKNPGRLGEKANQLDSLEKLTNKCSSLQTENRNLKANFMLQDSVMMYLKKIVDNLRTDFLALFAKCYAEHGEKFVDAMKTLDTNGIPEFLLQPLTQDAETNTETDELSIDDIPAINESMKKLKLDYGADEGIDSGVGSLTDEFRQLTTLLRNTKQENSRQEEALTKSQFKNEELKKEMLVKEHDHQQVLNDLLSQNMEPNIKIQELQNKIDDLAREAENARSESLSWSTALQVKDGEAKHFRNERDEARDKIKTLEDAIRNASRSMKPTPRVPLEIPPYTGGGYYPNVNEPYQEQSWYQQTDHRQMVVADGPRMTSPSVSNSPPNTTRTKRQSSEPTLKVTRESATMPKRQWSKSPMEAGEEGDEFWKGHVENVLQCEYCGDMYPLSILFDHMRTCKRH